MALYLFEHCSLPLLLPYWFRRFQKLVSPLTTNIPLCFITILSHRVLSWVPGGFFLFRLRLPGKELPFMCPQYLLLPWNIIWRWVFNVLPSLLLSFVQDEPACKKSVAYISFIHQTSVECLLCASYLGDFPKRRVNRENVKSCYELFTHPFKWS